MCIAIENMTMLAIRLILQQFFYVDHRKCTKMTETFGGVARIFYMLKYWGQALFSRFQHGGMEYRYKW